jgi:hypothetical protein
VFTFHIAGRTLLIALGTGMQQCIVFLFRTIGHEEIFSYDGFGLQRRFPRGLGLFPSGPGCGRKFGSNSRTATSVSLLDRHWSLRFSLFDSGPSCLGGRDDLRSGGSRHVALPGSFYRGWDQGFIITTATAIND